MNKKLKNYIIDIIKILLRKRSSVVWRGVYNCWDEALKKTAGYTDEQILDSVAEATQKVLDGDFPYERDGVLFDAVQYNWPLFTCFGYIAKNIAKPLSVVDFGGSLGSTYISNKWFFNTDTIKQWIVVEQSNFVERGRTLTQTANTHLFFAKHIDEVKRMNGDERVDVLLFSSVLQYLEQPFELVRQYIDALNPKYIIIDRTAFSESTAFVSVQKVRKQIVKSSYPIHFFSKDEFLNVILDRTEQNRSQYDKILEFDSFCDPAYYFVNHRKAVCWRGFLFKQHIV